VTDDDLAASVVRKARESNTVKEAFFTAEAARIVACARALAAAFDAGGRLYVMGNGGSLCDAVHVAVEFQHPIFAKRPALPAIALGADASLVTAIGNDDDFALIFARPLEVHGKRGDMALGISTSGKSANVLRGLKTARQLGMLTLGFAGRDGGGMSGCCDHLFVVPSFSIHRIQETHVALLHVLWDLVHVARGEEDILRSSARPRSPATTASSSVTAAAVDSAPSSSSACSSRRSATTSCRRSRTRPRSRRSTVASR
jgi:D-sedoheptulose 7-phosphate isomerase